MPTAVSDFVLAAGLPSLCGRSAPKEAFLAVLRA